MKPTFEGGKRIAYGARALNEGGFQVGAVLVTRPMNRVHFRLTEGPENIRTKV